MTAGAGANTIEALVLSALPQARKMAKNWVRRRPRLEYADVLSVAHERVVEAAHRYDATRGVPFPIFVAVQLRGAFADASRAALGRSIDKRLQQLPADLERAEHLRPAWASLAETFDDELRLHYFHQVLAQLPARRRLVIEQILGGVPQVAIAASLGVTEARVSQLKTDAIARMRHLLRVPCHPA